MFLVMLDTLRVNRTQAVLRDTQLVPETTINRQHIVYGLVRVAWLVHRNQAVQQVQMGRRPRWDLSALRLAGSAERMGRTSTDNILGSALSSANFTANPRCIAPQLRGAA